MMILTYFNGPRWFSLFFPMRPIAAAMFWRRVIINCHQPGMRRVCASNCWGKCLALKPSEILVILFLWFDPFILVPSMLVRGWSHPSTTLSPAVPLSIVSKVQRGCQNENCWAKDCYMCCVGYRLEVNSCPSRKALPIFRLPGFQINIDTTVSTSP